jgi:hypothetical protein
LSYVVFFIIHGDYVGLQIVIALGITPWAFYCVYYLDMFFTFIYNHNNPISNYVRQFVKRVITYLGVKWGRFAKKIDSVDDIVAPKVETFFVRCWKLFVTLFLGALALIIVGLVIWGLTMLSPITIIIILLVIIVLQLSRKRH